MNIPRLFLPYSLLLGVVIYAGGLALIQGRGPEAHWWSDLFWTIGAAVATRECFRTAREMQGPLRVAWRLLGLGCLSWFAGILVWDYLEVVQEDFQPFPGMQDYLCLALLPLFIAAFFHFRAETPYARAALRKLCNLAILLCGATVVLLLLKPHTVLAVSESPAWILTAAAYLVLSVGAVSFGVTCWVLYVGPAERRVLLITLLGLAAHSAGNFIYGYSVFRKNFAVGGAADFLWLLSFALIAWAAWEQRGQSPQALQPSRKDAPRPRLEELEATLPAVVIGAILLTAFLMREDLPRAVWNLLLPLLALLAVFVAVREWWSWHVESRLHAELQRSEARFRQVVDSNMSGIMFWRADGLVLDANEAFLEMAGYTRQDLENGRVTWEQLTPCEFRELCQAAFQEITATGICAPFEKEYLRKDGSRFPVLVGGARLPQEQDQGVCFVIDLSETKAARRELDEVQARLQLFLDHSPALIFMKDVEGRYLHVNSSFEKAIQRSACELIGRTDADFFPQEEAAEFEATDEAVKSTGTMLEFQMTTEHEDACRTNLVQKFPLLDHTGAIQAIGGIVTDITERHAAAEALRRSEERFRGLVEGAADAIFSINPQGVLTSVNAASTAISGWPREELQGRPFLPLVHPDGRALAQETWTAALHGEQPPPVELSLQRKQAGYVTLEFTVTPQFDENRVVEILGIGRDITERKQLEKQLRQAQRMESIGQLAGGVAHDFNNLLTVIQGHTSLLELNDALDAESKDSIQQIADAADRAANLTRQLLTFSRQQVMQSSHLNLNTVVGSMTKMLRRLLGEDVALEMTAAPNLPSILADTGMIEQILMNLAVNARDAMPNGGKLTISTTRRFVTEEEAELSSSARAGEFVHLGVSDTGSGIPPEHLARIFEPFYTTKDIGKGTGLGLATVYGVVNQHHGWIEVESTLGEGTRFDIYLPAVAKQTTAEATEPKAGPAIQRGNECILLVEDEAPLRLMVRIILEKFGYRVVEAGSGLQALETWKEHSSEISLLLTDMVMPDGISGRELGARLLAENPDLKVVYTSGYTDRFATDDFVLEEGRNFVQKPYQPEKLVRVIRENLDAPGATGITTPLGRPPVTPVVAVA